MALVISVTLRISGRKSKIGVQVNDAIGFDIISQRKIFGKSCVLPLLGRNKRLTSMLSERSSEAVRDQNGFAKAGLQAIVEQSISFHLVNY